LYKSVFAKRKVNLQHTVYFACRNCGWEGHISKFGTRCPKCDAPVGELPGV
jgi:predicted Zn-ribbon and HTH transcriptional regulator